MSGIVPPILLILCAGAVAITFGLSVTAKLRGRSAYAAFRRSLPDTLGVPQALAGPLSATVIAAEAAAVILLGAGLARPAFLTFGFFFSGVLLAAFTVAIALMLRRGVTQPCHCFGVGSKPPSKAVLARNLGLLAVAAIGAAMSARGVIPVVHNGASELTYLWIAVALLAVVGVGNLAVGWSILRQLRAHSELLRVSIEGVENPKPIMLEAGHNIAEFTATTIEGERVAKSNLRGQTLVCFLSATCPACAESLPGFILRAMDTPGGRAQVLAVLAGEERACAALSDRLAPVARVVIEPEHGPVAQAFKVDGFPAFAVLSDDTVLASHFVLDRLPELGEATPEAVSERV